MNIPSCPGKTKGKEKERATVRRWQVYRVLMSEVKKVRARKEHLHLNYHIITKDGFIFHADLWTKLCAGARGEP